MSHESEPYESGFFLGRKSCKQTKENKGEQIKKLSHGPVVVF